ncbi:hypothetical protein D9757_007593 [Collybiopsis confluens]|uniref:Uncharacterized protein n=1 Tax=Collybiopsis confluens TaxID=2823264 RepID=A0A8H5HF83_9AGAR|nr:hypothetical protein D9757_007593 [Collybiopsis confluens]
MAFRNAAFHLKQIHARITRNRLTTVFFLFALFHCFAQGIIQSLLFTVDARYSSFLFDIAAHLPPASHTDLALHGSGYQLKLCDYIPHNAADCSIVFDSTQNTTVDKTDPTTDAQLRGQIIISQLDRSSFTITTDIQQNVVTQVTFQADNKGGQLNMSSTCVKTLLYPAQQQVATPSLVSPLILPLSLSAFKTANERTSHSLVVLITRITLTAWSIYALWRTGWQQSVFEQMIEAPSTPCSAAMFGQYFSTRIMYEIPDLILNCTALGISTFLSWTLLRAYNVEVFTYVGAPKEIQKLYKYFLALQVCLQLETFVLITAAALWADQLFNTYINHISTHTGIYEALMIFYAIVLAPWLLMAWYGIRYEKRLVTIAFIFAGAVFTIVGALMFDSQVYQWTFYAWPCFGCFVTASLILLVASNVLGIVCLRNFGKGLAQFLYAESNLSSSNFAQEVFERDVEASYVDDEKLKDKGLHADFTTHYLPTLGPV